MQNLKHKPSDDIRSPNQIILSEKLTSAITELNLARIRHQQEKKDSSLHSSGPIQNFKKQKILFVCFTGIPPFENEFVQLNLPGEVITFILPGCQDNLTDDQLRERAVKCDFNTFSHEIDQKIQTYPNDYSLVFVYHSFGTFVAVYYFKNFYEKEKHRVKGIIELGAAPIRMYPNIETGIALSMQVTRQFIQENSQFIFERFNEYRKKWKEQKGVSTLAYKSKYNFMGALLSYKTDGFYDIFEMIRNLPKILKLSIYGEKDKMFQVKNLDEKAIFYLYNKDTTLDSEYEKNLSQKYNQVHGISPKNLQEKFIYKIKEGKHSLHMQKQLILAIRAMIADYLQIVL